MKVGTRHDTYAPHAAPGGDRPQPVRPACRLVEAVRRLGFVQADPIRSPARAQDLTLRHRVPGYRAGDLERHYASLDIEEDFFVNYGFLSRDVYALMHPRGGFGRWPSPGPKKAAAVLDFVRERGRVHPREVDAFFSHGSVTNYWGGSSSATTHLLDHLHYRGLLRVVSREGGIRVYAPQQHEPLALAPTERRARLDALLDVLLRKYAPIPSATLSWLTNRTAAGRAAVGVRREDRAGARQAAAAARPRGRRGVLLARGPFATGPGPGRRGAAAGAVRPGGVGSPAVRGVLGLGLSIRGLHAREEAQAGLLRVAVAVARRGDWLGQCLRQRWAAGHLVRIHRGLALRRGGRSHRRWSESASG